MCDVSALRREAPRLTYCLQCDCGRRQIGRGPAWRVREDELSWALHGGCAAGMGPIAHNLSAESLLDADRGGRFLHVNAKTFTSGTLLRPVLSQVIGGNKKPQD